MLSTLLLLSLVFLSHDLDSQQHLQHPEDRDSVALLQNARYIIHFNTSLSQHEQKKYLFSLLPCNTFTFIQRKYIPLDMKSDFAVVAANKNWLTLFNILEEYCNKKTSVIRNIEYDHSFSQSNSRRLCSENDDTQKDEYKLLPSSLSKDVFSAVGVQGHGVRVAIFDTGLTRGHPSFTHKPYERTDWTSDDTMDDTIGHGTFIAGVIAGSEEMCPGMAPDVDLHIFRIFNKHQKAYTSWFLDAFNYAIYLKVDIINLSIGGPDHGDWPFMHKIDEAAANGIIVVSAAGNDGPAWGSLHNPADQNSVIGVGGWRPAGSGEAGGEVASFSSRGMTLWNSQSRVRRSGLRSGKMSATSELDTVDTESLTVNHMGMGRVKPDILAPSYRLVSSSHVPPYSCRVLSGTSVANPIVVASIALLLSSIPSSGSSSVNKKRELVSNVAAMKQILMSTADHVQGFSVFEQGSGLLNLASASKYISDHVSHVSVTPSHISNYVSDCPLLWPWCEQKLFLSSQPLHATLTFLNSISCSSSVARIKWVESSELGVFSDELSLKLFDHSGRGSSTESLFTASLQTKLLTIRVESQRVFWPWAGNMEISVSVNEGSGYMGETDPSVAVSGEVECQLTVTLRGDSEGEHLGSEESVGSNSQDTRTATVTLRLNVTTPPGRPQRVLWDVFHSISFPSAFVPHDDPSDSRTKLDLLGDHPYTNYRETFMKLQQMGYVVDILRKPLTCFDARLYSILILSDMEDVLHPLEMNKLERDIRVEGLSVLVIADWYDDMSLLDGAMPDDNTHSVWFPITGGSNIPALNMFLERFGISFGVQAFKGSIKYKEHKIEYRTGNTLAKFPAGGFIWRSNAGEISPLFGGQLRSQFGMRQAFAGFLQVASGEEDGAYLRHSDLDSVQWEDLLVLTSNKSSAVKYLPSGRIVAFGDSSFIDMISNDKTSLYGNHKLLEILMKYLSEARLSPSDKSAWSSYPELLEKDFSDFRLSKAFSSFTSASPETLNRDKYLRQVEFQRYSKLYDSDGKFLPLEEFCAVF